MAPETSAARPEAAVVGVVGLGQMGGPIARRILGSGTPLAFYARRPDVMSELKDLGGIDGGSLEGVAGIADVVIVCVYDDAQVSDVCLEPNGLLTHMSPGSVLINHTTGNPGTARSLNERATASGVDFLDAALSGSPADIAEGQLTLWVGGSQDVLRKAEPVFRSYADPIIHVGEAGDGQWVKLVNNALFAANVALVSHAEQVLRAVGLEGASTMHALRHGSGDSSALGTIVKLGGSERLVELAGRFIAKDVATVKHVAEQQGIELGLLGDVADEMGASA